MKREVLPRTVARAPDAAFSVIAATRSTMLCGRRTGTYLWLGVGEPRQQLAHPIHCSFSCSEAARRAAISALHLRNDSVMTAMMIVLKSHVPSAVEITSRKVDVTGSTSKNSEGSASRATFMITQYAVRGSVENSREGCRS